MKRIKITAATAVTAALLVPLAIFAGPGFAHGSPSAAQYQYHGKTTICHHASKHGKTHTITVSNSALKAHRKHHDTVGPCPPPPPRPALTPPAHVEKHDADDDHRKAEGKDEDHGKPNANANANATTHGNGNGHGNGHDK